MSLTVFAGPMFSGKTTHMVSKVSLHLDIQPECRCVILTHSIDTRGDSNGKIITSHSSSYCGINDKILIKKCSSLAEIDVMDIDVIGIDEAQFFNDLHDTIKTWLDNDKHIYVCGLDSDFNGESFGKISTLLYLSDNFIKLQTICSTCVRSKNNIRNPDSFNKASFTAIMNKCTSLSSGDTSIEKNIKIGGNDMYSPMCRYHHKLHLLEK